MTATEAANYLDNLNNGLLSGSTTDALNCAVSTLRRVASGEYAPVVHAHWILDDSNPDNDPLIATAISEKWQLRCSNCGKKIIGSSSKHCGDCGAIMDEPVVSQTHGGKDDSHE